MRISDWSSDVCSSDLEPDRAALRDRHAQADGADRGHSTCVDDDLQGVAQREHGDLPETARADPAAQQPRQHGAIGDQPGIYRRYQYHPPAQILVAGQDSLRSGAGGYRRTRSEEHTSELQSLMRI